MARLTSLSAPENTDPLGSKSLPTAKGNYFGRLTKACLRSHVHHRVHEQDFRRLPGPLDFDRLDRRPTTRPVRNHSTLRWVRQDRTKTKRLIRRGSSRDRNSTHASAHGRYQQRSETNRAESTAHRQERPILDRPSSPHAHRGFNPTI